MNRNAVQIKSESRPKSPGIRSGVDGQPLEAYVNMENVFLTNELARAKDGADQVLLKHYYKFGLVLVALGLLQEAKRPRPVDEDGNEPPKKDEDKFEDDRATIFRLSGGIAAVIIPVVRNLAATAAKLVA
jgi:hypothetical protein